MVSKTPEFNFHIQQLNATKLNAILYRKFHYKNAIFVMEKLLFNPEVT